MDAKLAADEPLVTHRLGRLELRLPDWVELRGYRVRMNDIQLRELVWDEDPVDGDPADGDGFARSAGERWWSTYVDSLRREGGRPEGIASPIVMTARDGPLRWLHRYADAEAPRIRSVEAFCCDEQGGVHVSAEALDRFVDETMPVVKRLARHYRYFASGEAVPTDRPLFFVGEGAFELPFEEREFGSASYSVPSLEARLRVLFWTQMEDRQHPGLIALHREIVRDLAGQVSIRTLVARHSVVGGIPGEEVVKRSRDEWQSTYTFQFRSEGELRSGERPFLWLYLDSSSDDLDTLTALWNTLLDQARYGRTQ
jgi:hypothetical protein